MRVSLNAINNMPHPEERRRRVPGARLEGRTRPLQARNGAPPTKVIARLAALALTLMLAVAAPAAGAPTAADALATLRQACIAAAAALLQREWVVVSLERDIDLMGREADGRQRGLDETRG